MVHRPHAWLDEKEKEKVTWTLWGQQTLGLTPTWVRRNQELRDEHGA
jgi:hypothetical protein